MYAPEYLGRKSLHSTIVSAGSQRIISPVNKIFRTTSDEISSYTVLVALLPFSGSSAYHLGRQRLFTQDGTWP